MQTVENAPGGFGLDPARIAALRDAGLKPEEIGGEPSVQHARVGELLRWFARLLTGDANPKWLANHAYELAYYIAANGMNRAIDVSSIRLAAYLEGVNIKPGEREQLVRMGVAARIDTVTGDGSGTALPPFLGAERIAPSASHPVVAMLIEVARSAYLALDESEEREGEDGRIHVLDDTAFDDLSNALDKLDELPDDRPGCAMGPAQKAEWALRNSPAISTPQSEPSASVTGGDIAAGHFQYTEGRGWTEVQKQYAGESGVVVLYHEKGWPARQSSASAQQAKHCEHTMVPFYTGPVQTHFICVECDHRVPVAAPAPSASPAPKLTVFYGAMPESNGKSNWTAILHAGAIEDGVTLDRSEYPDRVRYEADRARYLIGELAEKPCIVEYDADKHSGYVPPARAGASPADQTAAARDVLAERRRQIDKGYTHELDDRLTNCALAIGALSYLQSRLIEKVGDYRGGLVKVGALMLAEIERLDRAAMIASKGGA